MSQDKLINNKSEYQSDCKRKYEDTEYVDSASAGNYEESRPKRSRIDNSSKGEVLLIDDNGHIKWHPGQQLAEFEIASALGEGTYGRVLRVKELKTGRLAALKVIKNERAKRKTAMGEIAVLKMIACLDPSDTSFCVKMLSSFSYAGHVCIVFPLLGVTVLDFLKNNYFQPFSIDEVCYISYQLCTAVSFLHANGMTHTDLKPENILFVDPKLKSMEIRLGDFGNVTRDRDYHQPIITTSYYRPPEVTLKLGWSNSCDMWSIGCIMFELYRGHLLFPTHEVREQLGMMEKILGDFPAEMVNASQTSYFKNGKLDWDWGQAAKGALEHCRPINKFQLRRNEADNQLFQLIQQMLKYQPNTRITSSAALIQPFFEKFISETRNPE